MTAPELICSSSRLVGASGEWDSVRMEGTGTIIPAQRGFGGSAPFPSALNHSGFRFPFSWRDYRAAGAGGGGSLGNGLCLILLSSFVCATVQRGLCSGVQETFCAGGDIKGWGCSQGELGNGGCCAGLHFKSHKMGFQNPGLSYKLQGCFFIIGAPVLGPFFCFLPSCRHFPAASQAQ